VSAGSLRAWALLGLVGLLGCKSENKSIDTRSSGIKSRELRIAFLKDYLSSPTEPLDVEFHLVLHDNSGGLISGPNDFDFRVAVKVTADAVARWAMGCEAARLDVRPEWVEAMLKGKKGWEVSSQPDTYRCGREQRVIHVHEGVIFRHVVSEG
jgi:hypothetical protein